MKKKIHYTDEPMEFKVINDFLPPPGQLVPREEETVKVTLSITKSSLEFFKREAKKNKTPYQRMIRNLLDIYAKKS